MGLCGWVSKKVQALLPSAAAPWQQLCHHPVTQCAQISRVLGVVPHRHTGIVQVAGVAAAQASLLHSTQQLPN